MATAGQDHLYPKVELAGTGVDPYTGAQGVISEPHLLIHQGKMYHADRKVASIASLASEDMLITVPAGIYPHMHRLRVNLSAGDVDLIQYENPTVTGSGVAISSHNLNRNSANTPSTGIAHSPTVSAVGTELHKIWVPSAGTGVGQSVMGIQNAEAGEEWILKPDEHYLVRLTNNGGSAITAWFEFMWYEL